MSRNGNKTHREITYYEQQFVIIILQSSENLEIYLRKILLLKIIEDTLCYTKRRLPEHRSFFEPCFQNAHVLMYYYAGLRKKSI